MAQMTLAGRERKTRGQPFQTSWGGASYFLQEDYGTIHMQASLQTSIRQQWIKYEMPKRCFKTICLDFFCYIYFRDFISQTDVLTKVFLTMKICNLFALGKDLLVKRQIALYPAARERVWWATSENRNGVKRSLLLPPSFLTNEAAIERPLWVSCNFRQPLAGVGDLSSSQPSFSSASVSYLWPPSKVNVQPRVEINSALTDQRPSLLLPLSTSTHTSPTTGEIRASLADLTAPLNTAPDRSLIAWL